MSANIRIPTALRNYTDGLSTVSVEGATVGEALGDLTTKYTALNKHLRGKDGALRSFVNVYLGDEDIRFLEKEATPLKDGAELSIVPSIAGGL